jgi:tetratricopeptide (TPR) repeat protein
MHLLRADPAGDRWVVSMLCEAAERALERGAPDAAVALLTRALDEPAGEQRGAVLARLGRAERRAARPADAARHLHEAVRLAAPSEHADLARELAQTLSYDNRHEEAAAALEAAIADLEGPEEQVREARLRLEAEFAFVAVARERLIDHGIERLERAAVGLRGDTPAERALLAMHAYQRYWSAAASADAVVAELERVLERGSLAEELTPG